MCWDDMYVGVVGRYLVARRECIEGLLRVENFFTRGREELWVFTCGRTGEGTAPIRCAIYRLLKSEISVVDFITGSWLMEMLDSAVLVTLKWQNLSEMLKRV